MLWLKTSGAASTTRSMAPGLPKKSGVSTSTVAPVALPHGQHRMIKMLGAAVGQVIARDRSNHHVSQAQSHGRFGHAVRLIGFQRLGLALGHGAKSAGPRADVAQDHEGGRLLRPALHAVGALGAFAHRFQPQFFDQPGGEMIRRRPLGRFRFSQRGNRPAGDSDGSCRGASGRSAEMIGSSVNTRSVSQWIAIAAA